MKKTLIVCTGSEIPLLRLNCAELFQFRTVFLFNFVHQLLDQRHDGCVLNKLNLKQVKSIIFIYIRVSFVTYSETSLSVPRIAPTIKLILLTRPLIKNKFALTNWPSLSRDNLQLIRFGLAQYYIFCPLYWNYEKNYHHIEGLLKLKPISKIFFLKTST